MSGGSASGTEPATGRTGLEATGEGRRILPMGERALLVEVGSLAEVLPLRAALEESRPDGVVDLVPAARTVLVRVDPTVLPLAAARSWIERRRPSDDTSAEHARLVELDIVYDGADLADTAALLGVAPDELARRHAAAEWTVAFTGFAPGFGYLVSDDWPYDVPRLASPRTRVPAGAVGVAAAFTGAYPRETPGGWRLLGTTPERLFDPDAGAPASAALLTPGTRVRFRPAAAPPASARETASGRRDDGETPTARRSDAVSRAAGPERGREHGPERGRGGGRSELRIVEPGQLATLQDLGRPGVAALGVAGSGALDRGALRTANRLLGNPEGAAAIEVTLGGFRAVASTDVWFAVTGAWGPIRLADDGHTHVGRTHDGHTHDGRTHDLDPYQAHLWPAGAELRLDRFAHGARAYLAVRGGLGGRVVLGSRSTDVLSGLGPDRLAPGSLVGVVDGAAEPVPATPVAPWGAPHDDDVEIELAPGARAGWFAASALRLLFDSVWMVTDDADRVGMRLDGPVLERARPGELPSEGMVPGAVQVSPSGRPTILLADGPVTGGYPVIAVVADASLDLLAQARPGTRIRFRHARPS